MTLTQQFLDRSHIASDRWGILIKPEKDVVMRSAIFASVVLASAVISFGASACDPKPIYDQKISNLLDKYQNQIVQANDAFARATYPVTEVVYEGGRHHRYRYFVNYRPYLYNAAVDQWKGSVDAAVTNYSSEAKAAHDNACLGW